MTQRVNQPGAKQEGGSGGGAGERRCAGCGDDHAPAGPDCPAQRIGQVVAGKYRLDALVGTGAFAAVYLAEHLGLGRKVALKVLKNKHMRERQLVKRFKQEARKAAALRHPAVIDVHDIGDDADGVPYIEMEYLEGLTLGQLLRRDGKLPWPRAVALATQLAEALALAHEAGIVHRDVKPENLFLAVDARGGEQLKVLDFGIAKVLGEDAAIAPMTAAGRPLGTPYYMSPEQAIDPSRVDARADIYSLGATLYEMLTGRPCAPAGDVVSIIRRVIDGDIDRHPRAQRQEVPAWLDQIVARTLAKRPEERFASARELQAALERGGAVLFDDEETRLARGSLGAAGRQSFHEVATVPFQPLAPTLPPKQADTVEPTRPGGPSGGGGVGADTAPAAGLEAAVAADAQAAIAGPPLIAAPLAAAGARASAPRRRLPLAWVGGAAAIALLAAALAIFGRGRTALPAAGTTTAALERLHFAAADRALDAGDARLVLEELSLSGPLAATPEGLMLDGRARLMLGDLDGAAQALDMALAAGLDDRDAALARAAIDLRRGDLRGAATRARLLYAQWPDPEVAVIYGTALRLLGERGKARPILEAAAASPRGGRALLELARLEREVGRFPEAQKAYLLAIAAAPTVPEPRLESATLALDLGDLDAARAGIDALVAAPQASREVLAVCARVRTLSGDLAGAAACLALAADRPTTPALRREEGRLALERGAAAEALAPLADALAGDGADGEALLLLVEARLLVGDDGKAAELVAAAETGFAEAPELQLARGRLALHRVRPDEARAAFAAALAALEARFAPPRLLADAQVWLARAELARGRSRPARDLLRAATARWPDPEGLFQLAELERRFGGVAAALTAYDAYLVVAPDGRHAEAARKGRRAVTPAAPPPVIKDPTPPAPPEPASMPDAG